VAQIAAGDVGVPVPELYRRYGKRLYRLGVQQRGNEGVAEEMVQETFVRLWRTAGRIADRPGLPLGTVKTWTFHGMRALRTALIERGFHAI
jgi:RNA polymerase sigma-70 factor (ECF subfamily)